MAQTALPAPRQSPGRRRAFFGLFDANGWGWATTKALFWFVLIIVLLGYIPDRAYYFTVQRTVDIGLLSWSPINFCPPDNQTLPCPAPVGATLPWQVAPDVLQLPQSRTHGAAVALGNAYVYIGGSDGTKAQASVFVAKAVATGNFDKWADGPALPAARSDMAAVVLGSTVYVIGGTDDAGKATDTVYSLTIDGEGNLGDWKTEDALKLAAPRTGASAAPVSDGIVVMGGADADGKPTTDVLKSQQDAKGVLQAWTPQQPLGEENVGGTAVHVGDVLFLVGGRNASGKPVASVQQGHVGGKGATTKDPNVITELWRTSAQTNLPEPRANAAVFSANGTIYVSGGTDGTAPHAESWWAIPDANGVIDSWKRLPQTDLGEGNEGASAFTSGSEVFIIGGTTASGATPGAARANLAPQPPFFQLGILGATVPALKLDGEIGQQLGYLNAAGAGTVNFVLLLVVGWAYAHKERVRELVANRRARRERR